MNEHRIGIIMNGVTGRMGTNQHLFRSIASIIKQGGIPIKPDEVIMPNPILVGRNPDKLKNMEFMGKGQRRATGRKSHRVMAAEVLD